MKRIRAWVGLAVLLVAVFGLGYLFASLRPGPLVLHQDAVVQGVDAVNIKTTYEQGVINIRPRGGGDILFVFYPGGLVRPQAYEWLGVALAAYGVQTLIPVFPLDLAVFSPGRAKPLIDEFEEKLNYRAVLVGGHSLGGAMAARYTRNHPEQVDGLVLMGAFSADDDDLSNLDVPTLSLAASRDGLATVAEVRASLARLPEDTRMVVIEGAVHSFFGRYGPQRGDGLPTVSRAQAEAQITRVLERFIDQVIAEAN